MGKLIPFRPRPDVPEPIEIGRRLLELLGAPEPRLPWPLAEPNGGRED